MIVGTMFVWTPVTGMEVLDRIEDARATRTACQNCDGAVDGKALSGHGSPAGSESDCSHAVVGRSIRRHGCQLDHGPGHDTGATPDNSHSST